MSSVHSIVHIVVLASATLAVIMDPTANIDEHHIHPEFSQSEEPRSFNDALQTCFNGRAYSTWECMNRGAMTALQSLNDDDCLDFGDVKLDRSEGESRNILDLDWDTKDFGNVLKATSRLLERRNLKWDLSNLYPGLQMRVGPTLSAGNGMLEFVMDERSKHLHTHDRQIGTGRLLMRQLVLPFLLGFKFNLASLLPLLFGMLIIITKKALLLTKVALLIAGVLGWNSLFTGVQTSQEESIVGENSLYGGYRPQINPGLGATVVQNPNYQYQQNQPYRGVPEGLGATFPFGQHIIREIVNVYEKATNNEHEESDRRKKNFVWSRNEP